MGPDMDDIDTPDLIGPLGVEWMIEINGSVTTGIHSHLSRTPETNSLYLDFRCIIYQEGHLVVCCTGQISGFSRHFL